MADLTTPRVTLAEALLPRQGPETAAPDVRATLAEVRSGLKQVTDAAALRQLLAGLAEVQPIGVPAHKDDVSLVEKVVDVGTKLVGTPTEREKALQEALKEREDRLRRLEDAIDGLKTALWEQRHNDRRAEREDTLSMAQFMAQQTQMLIELLKDARKAPDDDLRTQLANLALQLVMQPRRSELQEYAEQTKQLRDLGLLPDPQASVPPWLRDPHMFGAWLGYQRDLKQIEAEQQKQVKQEEVAAERAKAFGPVAGLLASAFATRWSGPEAADPAAPAPGASAPASPPPPAPAARAPRTPTQLITCPTCGERWAAASGRTEYRCPNPTCGQLLTIGPAAPPAAGE